MIAMGASRSCRVEVRLSAGSHRVLKKHLNSKSSVRGVSNILR